MWEADFRHGLLEVSNDTSFDTFLWLGKRRGPQDNQEWKN